MFKAYICYYCKNLFIYFLFYSILKTLPFSIQKTGLLNNSLNLMHLIQDKAIYSASLMTESNLALNFVGNIHKLTTFEKNIFQTSGLVHLLAISGGQILPITALCSAIISKFIFKFFHQKRPPHEIMKKCYFINSFVNFFLSFFIAILFGGTGALMRVSWMNFLRKMNLFHFIYKKIFELQYIFEEVIFDKIILIFTASILFGNIFSNFSFLLSAIGAACAELCAKLTMLLFSHGKKMFKKKKEFLWLAKSRVLQELSMTVTTCILVGIILAPLTNNSILNSCLANIYAIPVVTFLITPLSILSLIIPSQNIIFPIVVNLLDICLGLLKQIAVIFSEETTHLKQNLNLLLFSEDGLLYLNLVLIVLWGVSDMLKSRNLISMRLCIKRL